MKKTFTILFILAAFQLASFGQAKYVFYFIGDGMGQSHVNITEAYKAAMDGKIGNEKLSFTGFPVFGYATNFAGNRYVTCSAAAGTALATGQKTSINTIGMNTDRTEAIYSVAASAAKKGRKVGVATSVSIDHATPAAFYAHQPDRNFSYEIAMDGIESNFDFYAGGDFLEPVSRKDSSKMDVYSAYKKAGYTLSRQDKKTGDKLLFLAKQNYRDNSLYYAIDRQGDELTLSDITTRAIEFLGKSDTGFFVMIEGGKIDWAAHSNDAAAVVHEVMDFSDAIAIAYKFYEQHPNETLIVVTADHETGGISLGRGESGYDISLAVLANQKVSFEMLKDMMRATKSWQEAIEVLTETMGFWMKVPVSDVETNSLIEAYKTSPNDAAMAAIRLMDKKAGIGWTTGSHTGMVIPVFAVGVGAENFGGRMDNTDIPKKIDKLID